MPKDPPRYAFIPCGTSALASARIRVHALRRSLADLDVSASIGPHPRAGTLFIQKRWDRRALSLARRARRAERRVIFDLDDPVERESPGFLEMLRLADTVTTDTASRRDWLIRSYGLSRVEVLPDCVDYLPAAPVRPLVRAGTLLRVLWFGSFSHLGLLKKYLPALRAMDGLQLVVCTDAGALPKLRRRHPEVEFAAWSRSRFIDVLQSCDLSCLMHDGSTADRMKSNNRMITSIVWGVPAVISRTPEYERTAREAGVESSLFGGPAELRRRIEALRPPRARASYLSKSQSALWARYSPETVAKRFLALTERPSRIRPVEPPCRPEAGAPERRRRTK